MSRKHCRRVIRPASPPMLVNRGLQDAEIQMRELQFVEAFAGGWATTEHYDSLCDMRNILTLAAACKDDKSVLAICDAMRIPMANLRDRYAKLNRFGVTGPELQLLKEFVDVYRDFWMRQPVTLYTKACDELNRFNTGQNAQRKAA